MSLVSLCLFMTRVVHHRGTESRGSFWMFAEAAVRVFDYAKRRVYQVVQRKKVEQIGAPLDSSPGGMSTKANEEGSEGEEEGEGEEEEEKAGEAKSSGGKGKGGKGGRRSRAPKGRGRVGRGGRGRGRASGRGGAGVGAVGGLPGASVGAAVNSSSVELRVVLEEMPKWRALLDLLLEICTPDGALPAAASVRNENGGLARDSSAGGAQTEAEAVAGSAAENGGSSKGAAAGVDGSEAGMGSLSAGSESMKGVGSTTSIVRRGRPKVLVVCRDDAMCNQLREVVFLGAERVMEKEWARYVSGQADLLRLRVRKRKARQGGGAATSGAEGSAGGGGAGPGQSQEHGSVEDRALLYAAAQEDELQGTRVGNSANGASDSIDTSIDGGLRARGEKKRGARGGGPPKAHPRAGQLAGKRRRKLPPSAAAAAAAAGRDEENPIDKAVNKLAEWTEAAGDSSDLNLENGGGSGDGSEEQAHGSVQGMSELRALVRFCAFERNLRMLDVENPTHVVVFDPEIEFVRQLEVYQAEGHLRRTAAARHAAAAQDELGSGRGGGDAGLVGTDRAAGTEGGSVRAQGGSLGTGDEGPGAQGEAQAQPQVQAKAGGVPVNQKVGLASGSGRHGEPVTSHEQQGVGTGPAWSDEPLRVYFLFYDGSTEGHKFEASVRRENGSFESLIRQKNLVTLPKEEDVFRDLRGDGQDREGQTETAYSLGLTMNSLTRKGGGRRNTARPREMSIVVDMREFNSSLPCVLHQQVWCCAPHVHQQGRCCAPLV